MIYRPDSLEYSNGPDPNSDSGRKKKSGLLGTSAHRYGDLIDMEAPVTKNAITELFGVLSRYVPDPLAPSSDKEFPMHVAAQKKYGAWDRAKVCESTQRVEREYRQWEGAFRDVGKQKPHCRTWQGLCGEEKKRRGGGQIGIFVVDGEPRPRN